MPLPICPIVFSKWYYQQYPAYLFPNLFAPNYTQSANDELHLLFVVLMQFRWLIVLWLPGLQLQFMAWRRHQL